MKISANQKIVQKGYKHISAFISEEWQAKLELEYSDLYRKAIAIASSQKQQGINQEAYYKRYPTQLIVSYEDNVSNDICRFEQITRSSEFIATQLVPSLQALLKECTGKNFNLFKDKCNLKSPGGGAFTPHQDIVAYQYFQPSYYLTVAVMLDDSTYENGCLQMARHYRANKATPKQIVSNDMGEFPIYPYHIGGEHNGDINKNVSAMFDWDSIQAKKGDVIIFDAFVPHCSEVNKSDNHRRIFFFTFNLCTEGRHYADYYLKKTQAPNSPIFHMATPTDYLNTT